MKILAFSLVLLAVPFASAGVVILEEVEQTGGPTPGKMSLTIRASGDRTRVDVGDEVSSIVDAKTGTVTSLMHAQKMAMQLPEGTLAAVKQKSADTKPDLKPPGKTETINGFKCEEYAGTIEKMKVSIWVTREVENAAEILEQLGKLSKGGADPLAAALQNSDHVPGFPIRTSVDVPKLGRSTMTILSIKHEDVPDTTFDLPAGYQTMDMPKTSNPGAGAPARPAASDGN